MTIWQKLSAFIWRHSRVIRLCLAAGCAIAAIASFSNASEPPKLSEVVVAARDIEAGATLAEADLALAQDSLGLTTPQRQTLLGETVRGPVVAGEPVTESRLTPGRSLAPPPGSVVFPLTLEDERIAELLTAGDRVDVLVTPDSLNEDATGLTVSDVEVLTVPLPAGDSLRPTLGRSGAVVLLAVDTDAAADLAQIRRSDHVTVTIR